MDGTLARLAPSRDVHSAQAGDMPECPPKAMPSHRATLNAL